MTEETRNFSIKKRTSEEVEDEIYRLCDVIESERHFKRE